MTEAMWIAVAGFALVLILVFLRVWVGFALLGVGVVGLIVLRDFNFATSFVGMEPFSQTAVYSFTCMPLFCIMGTIIANTGMGEKLYTWAKTLVGHIRGGLGMATVVACGVFAAICGNSTVTGMTMGKVAFPEMKKAGYSGGIAAGGIAAGGGIGIMIPPSAGFIVYGLLTEEPIGQLFMAGFIPGILQVILFCFTFWLIGKAKPALVPATPNKTPFKESMKAFSSVWSVVLMMIVVLGGIYGGIFTATEAGAIGAAAAIIIAAGTRTLTKRVLYDSFVEGAKLTGMVMMMVVGSKVFLRFITVSQLTGFLTDLIVNMDVSRYVILFFVFLLYLVIGCVFDIMAGILLTVPVLYPIMTALGFDPIWFGVFVVAMMELGEITPPIGLNCFVIAGSTNQPVGAVFKGVLPFIAADIILVLIISVFPQIPLVLLKYGHKFRFGVYIHPSRLQTDEEAMELIRTACQKYRSRHVWYVFRWPFTTAQRRIMTDYVRSFRRD